MQTREPLASLGRAEKALERERCRCEDEIDAFEQFRQRVTTRGRRATAACAQSIHGPEPAALRVSTEAGTDPDWIRDTYRETVMAADPVAELEESPRQHAVNEMGADIASAIFDDGGTPGLALGPLQAASRKVVAQRRRVIKWLDAEADDLAEARIVLSDAVEEIAALEDRIGSAPPAELFADYDRFPEILDKCERLAADRQSTLHKSRFSDSEAVSLGVEYLYADCEFTYPVLTAVTATIDWAEDCQAQLEQCLADLG